MKRFLLAIPILMLLVCATAAADNFNQLFPPRVTIVLDGEDNFGFFGSGPGYSLEIFGEAGLPGPFRPGDSFGPNFDIPVYVDLAYLPIPGGFDSGFDPEGPGSLSIFPDFTFPTNGQETFSAPVEIDFVWDVLVLSDGSTLEIDGGAVGKLTFEFDPRFFGGVYFLQPSEVMTTPEPGPFFLTATGLAGIWMKRRSRGWGRLLPFKWNRSSR